MYLVWSEKGHYKKEKQEPNLSDGNILAVTKPNCSQ